VTPATILIADDDRAIRTVLSQALGRLGHEVRTTGHAATLWRWVETGVGDLVITDVIMPDENGLDLVPRIRKVRPSLRVIVMSAQNTLLTAVKAAERGAFEYLPKPFDLRELVGVVERALSQPAPAPAPEQPQDQERLPIIGRSPAMQEIYRILARLMGTDLTVLITGESGTGKELVAKALHDYGKRRSGPFVAVNMAAIPRELIESELFGHERGAFTGASTRSAGRFEQAIGGTLFLDEAAPGAPERGVSAGRRAHAHPCRCAHHRRHPSRPAPARASGAVPRGPVLQAQRRPDPPAGPARAKRGRARARCPFPH
jgi:two-component system nitrogen regulation response regulator GlnG